MKLVRCSEASHIEIIRADVKCEYCGWSGRVNYIGDPRNFFRSLELQDCKQCGRCSADNPKQRDGIK